MYTQRSGLCPWDTHLRALRISSVLQCPRYANEMAGSWEPREDGSAHQRVPGRIRRVWLNI